MSTGVTKIEHDRGTSLSRTFLEISNEGYPREDVMTGDFEEEDENDPGDDVIFSWHTRWSDILDAWHNSMPGLRVFKMGLGAWHNDLCHFVVVANSLPGELRRFRSMSHEDPGWASEPDDSEAEEYAREQADEERDLLDRQYADHE